MAVVVCFLSRFALNDVVSLLLRWNCGDGTRARATVDVVAVVVVPAAVDGNTTVASLEEEEEEGKTVAAAASCARVSSARDGTGGGFLSSSSSSSSLLLLFVSSFVGSGLLGSEFIRRRWRYLQESRRLPVASDIDRPSPLSLQWTICSITNDVRRCASDDPVANSVLASVLVGNDLLVFRYENDHLSTSTRLCRQRVFVWLVVL